MLYRLIYLSSASAAFRRSDLDSILRTARDANPPAGITGLLIYHDGNFLQVLEGPRDAVEACYARIEQDPRHYGCARVIAEEVEARIFGDWEMAAIPLEEAPAEAREGFVNLRRLHKSDTLRRASSDPACRVFIESFLLSFRGG